MAGVRRLTHSRAAQLPVWFSVFLLKIHSLLSHLPRGVQTAKDDKTAKLADDRKKLSDHGLKDGGTV